MNFCEKEKYRTFSLKIKIDRKNFCEKDHRCRVAHHVSLLSHGLLGTTECSAVTVCSDVADDGGLHSLVLSTRVELQYTRLSVLHSYLPCFFCSSLFLVIQPMIFQICVTFFSYSIGRLCCWLEGVPNPGPVQGIVVPAVTLDRYWCIPRITATLHNVLIVSFLLGSS